jgi:hypothetical protein
MKQWHRMAEHPADTDGGGTHPIRSIENGHDLPRASVLLMQDAL